MKKTRFAWSTFLAVTIVLSLLSTGCLSVGFGGRTVTYKCEGGKHSEERIAVLENRIKVLEQYAGISPPTSRESTVSVASVITEGPVNHPIPTAPQPLYQPNVAANSAGY